MVLPGKIDYGIPQGCTEESTNTGKYARWFQQINTVLWLLQYRRAEAAVSDKQHTKEVQ